MKNSDIVSKLGEPTKKFGGNLTNISIGYDRLGIEFTFFTKIWDDNNSPIMFLCFY